VINNPGGLFMPRELTKIQKKILDYLLDQKVEKGIPPTLAEIANKFGYRNRTTVQQHLGALEKKGFIKRSPKLSRGIEITVEQKFFIPRPVIGEVAAGNPLTIYPDSIDTVDLPSIARMPKDSFLLRVKGDSLKDAYIFSGDIVIVNPNREPLNGQIVVAILDDSAVIKRFFKKNERLELHSENPEYKPIIVQKNYPRFKIVGVAVGVYRTMEKKAG
jgi:repressor LexA